MMLFLKNLLINFPKAIIGELKNNSNRYDKRFMRVLAKTPLNSFFLSIYLIFFKKKNKVNLISDKNLFVGIENEKNVLKNIQNDGIFRGFYLKEKVINEILEIIQNKKFLINREKSKTILLNDKKENDGVYICRYLNPHKDLKIVNDIAYNKTLINVAANYFKTNPIVQSSQIWWTFNLSDKKGNSINPPGNEFGYHYDVDDFKFLKLFVYLSNVDEKSGPHYFIKKEGKKNFNEYVSRRISDDEAIERYNDRIILLTGKKGTSFIEDTSNYHKGSNPEKNNSRGILQVIYAISEW